MFIPYLASYYFDVNAVVSVEPVVHHSPSGINQLDDFVGVTVVTRSKNYDFVHVANLLKELLEEWTQVHSNFEILAVQINLNHEISLI